MSLLDFLLLLLVAGICGSLGQALVGYSIGGCLVSILVGFVGALFGNWLAGQLGLPEPLVVTVGGKPFPIMWSIIDSALFVGLLSLFRGRRFVA